MTPKLSEMKRNGLARTIRKEQKQRRVKKKKNTCPMVSNQITKMDKEMGIQSGDHHVTTFPIIFSLKKYAVEN
jgi:hypothetical protein